MQRLTDAELTALTSWFRARHAAGEPLFSLLPEAFAAVREAAVRVLGMRQYDVQLLGGIVLAEGQIAEMGTGEGKTLAAALPAYLHALTGRGVHVVTVNDYLAQRDAAWIGKVLEFLGLEIGVVVGTSAEEDRKRGFAADVTYVTAYELAFTFLGDNIASSVNRVALRRPLYYAIVDEVDSILVDEARNPFIITLPDEKGGAASAWRCAIDIAKRLQGPPEGFFESNADFEASGVVPREPLPFDFLPDYRSRIATLTEQGMRNAVRLLASPEFDQILVVVSSNDHNELHVVMLAPTADGNIEMVIRPAGGTHPHGASTVAVDAPTTDKERSVVVSSRAEVAPALSALGLRLLSLHNGGDNDDDNDIISDADWSAVAAAALWADADRAWGRFINQAVRAQHLFIRDIHYIIKNEAVVIIDTATGREKANSRWQAGVHQAIEAKEAAAGIKIKPESYDQGRITYQSLFNLYSTLGGMTGTAATEAEEFSEAYGVTVVRVPPHRPSRRVDSPTVVYVGVQGWEARVKGIVKTAISAGRPVLLGTSSVEESERVLQLVSEIPYQAPLSELDVRRLGKALEMLPDSLPPPRDSLLDSSLGSKKQLSTEEIQALEQYYVYMDRYESIVRVLQRVVLSRRLSPELSDVVATAPCLLRLFLQNGLFYEDEGVEVQEVIDVVTQLVKRAALGAVVSINLLNARPGRARREAETIAQAGLPGTITVATAMAGRGTDILLGGNPKGLTLIALQHCLLPVLTCDDDGENEDVYQLPPLTGLPEGRAFLSEADMRLHLPPALFNAYSEAKNAAAAASSKNKNKMMPAAEVCEYLAALLETVEVERSNYLLTMNRQGLTPSLEAALEWRESSSTKNTNTQNTNTQTAVDVAVRRYALLQWLWFDSQCERYATQVRAAGGLVAIITSLQETRRTELQLRGRAGRQGDPGETHLISHRDDPAVRATLNVAQIQSFWDKVEQGLSVYEPIPALAINAGLKNFTAQGEQAGWSGREQTRKYDVVIDPYRRHVFRLRRTIAGGGDAGRTALSHRQLRYLAVDLVAAHCDPGKHPREWKIEELLNSSVQMLFRREQELLLVVGDQKERNNRIIEVDGPMQLSTGCVEQHTAAGGGGGGVSLQFVVHMDSGGSAEVVKEALCQNQSLPLFDIFDTNSNSNTSSGWMPVRRRVVLQEARRAQEVHGATTTIKQNKKKGGVNASAIARLEMWLGDLLTILFERKRLETAASLRRCLSSSASGSSVLGTDTPLHATSMLRLWERDAMLSCLDALWSDFLQDVTTLQRATQSRAFSQFDPVDEFKLELSVVFARLLSDFRRQAAVAVMGPVLLNEVASSHFSSMGAVMDEKVEAMVNEASWLADWAVEEEESEGGGGVDSNDDSSSTADSTIDSVDEMAMIEKLLSRLSQAPGDELSAAIETLDRKWKKSDGGNE